MRWNLPKLVSDILARRKTLGVTCFSRIIMIKANLLTSHSLAFFSYCLLFVKGNKLIIMVISSLIWNPIYDLLKNETPKNYGRLGGDTWTWTRSDSWWNIDVDVSMTMWAANWGNWVMKGIYCPKKGFSSGMITVTSVFQRHKGTFLAGCW